MRTSAGDSVTTMIAGTTRNLVITAKDGSGNTVTTYTGAKTLLFSGADSSHSPAIAAERHEQRRDGNVLRCEYLHHIHERCGTGHRQQQRRAPAVSRADCDHRRDRRDDHIRRERPIACDRGPGALGKFFWVLNSPQTSGVAFTGINTLTAQDDWGNTVTTFDASTTNVTLSTTLGGTITGLGTGNNDDPQSQRRLSSVAMANLTALGMKYTGRRRHDGLHRDRRREGGHVGQCDDLCRVRRRISC